KKAATKKAATKKAATKKAATKKATATKATGKKATGRRNADALSEIRGLGPGKRDALLARFGSVDGIAAASVDDISAIPGIGTGLAATIKQQLG
ncbi:MAG: helix-hairpin-helix domain-containing protein, partial [Nitriliruptor sp.]